DAVRLDAGYERLRAFHRAQIPGAVRMTDAPIEAGAAVAARRDIGIRRRNAAERRFKIYGIVAIAVGLFFLIALLGSVVSDGYTAFWQTSILLPIEFDPAVIDPDNKRASEPSVLYRANYPRLAQDAIVKKLGIDPAN